MRSTALIVFVLGFALAQGPDLQAAAQRPGPAEMVPYGELESFLSPNELQLAELQRERQNLLQNRDAETNPRILKNKITILNNKIAFLQRQIKLTRPYMVSQRLVPVAVKGAADNAQRFQAEEIALPKPAPAPVVRTPLALSARPFLISEKRADAETAELPKKLSIAPPAVPAVREKAVQAALPAKIAAKPVEVPAVRAPAAPRALPVPLNPKSFGNTAPREGALSKTLPVRIQPKAFASVSQRLAPQEAPVPVKPAAVRAAAPAAEQKAVTGKTGADWKKMARPDKEIYILSIMGNLSRHDVYLMKPYSFYIQSIDRAIEQNPLLEKEFVHRILMTSAYDSEPDTRKDLEKVWK